ncbi:hypothetical protein E2C01_052372 [Portunus trituberculatus]|uniref:Uncharacterized protein n=1 Tax=Portunus trituberculatus TaxID=210409 RepID=A0A5B7GDI1_PORTR|nr:hypothetical protein [Portunus trituberculatus]
MRGRNNPTELQGRPHTSPDKGLLFLYFLPVVRQKAGGKMVLHCSPPQSAPRPSPAIERQNDFIAYFFFFQIFTTFNVERNYSSVASQGGWREQGKALNQTGSSCYT